MNNDEFSNPQPTLLTKKAVYKLAENVAKQLEYQAGGDITTVVNKLGGKIKLRNFWDSEKNDEAIEVEGPNDFTIYISADTLPERDRFTVAHELGHYVLHFLWQNQKRNMNVAKLSATRYGSERVEWEANWFAAAFLMPDQEFRDVHMKNSSDIAKTALHFGVTQAAANVRAKSLGIC